MLVSRRRWRKSRVPPKLPAGKAAARPPFFFWNWKEPHRQRRSGWGEPSCNKDHPTPLASRATLPLQGRVSCCAGVRPFQIQFSNSPRASTHIQTRMIHRPHCLFGHSAAKTRVNALLGPPSSSFPHPTLPFPHNVRERSAERRWVTSGTLRRRRALCDQRARLPALHCGDFSPRGRASGEGPGERSPRVTCGFRRRRSTPASSH